MSDNKFARYAGFGSILAGIIWLALILVDRAGSSVFNGDFWDYLGVLAVALVLMLALALIFPASFAFFGGILDVDISGDLAGAIWISTMIAQVLGWIVLGAITLALQGSTVERPVESAGWVG